MQKIMLLYGYFAMDPIAVRNFYNPPLVDKSQLGQGALAAPFYLPHYLMI